MNQSDTVEGRRIRELEIKLEAAIDKLDTIDQQLFSGGCTQGLRDYKNSIGIHGIEISGQYVDAYGKPNGWCWSCWRSYQLTEALQKVELLERGIDLLKQSDEALRKQAQENKQQVHNAAEDVQKMTFIRGILERAERADMNMETTDRFIVREIQRICKADKKTIDLAARLIEEAKTDDGFFWKSRAVKLDKDLKDAQELARECALRTVEDLRTNKNIEYACTAFPLCDKK